MGMEFTVRNFKPEDEQAVLDLYRATPELHKNTVVDFLEAGQRELWFTRQDKLFLVAVDKNGKLLGFIYVNVKPESIDEEKARMLHLVTLPGQRGGGIGKKLLSECARRLFDVGITHFYFNVNEKNVGMALFAQRLGFSEAGRYARFEVRLDTKLVESWSAVSLASDWYLDGLDPEL